MDKRDAKAPTLWAPVIRAQLWLNHKKPSKALELVENVSPSELTDYGGIGIYCVYLRGYANLLAPHPYNAEAEFQELLDHRGILVNSPVGTLALIGLARARVSKGDTAGAKTAFEQFFTAWKNADPDIPILVAAKAEYAKLQ